jgi:hypothetical protein
MVFVTADATAAVANRSTFVMTVFAVLISARFSS